MSPKFLLSERTKEACNMVVKWYVRLIVCTLLATIYKILLALPLNKGGTTIGGGGTRTI